MKKLTAVMAVGAVAACAYASAENTVTLKRDVLGRALGTNQKQPVLLKNTTVQKTAEPLAATSTSKTYASMKNVFADNPFNDANDNIERVYGAMVTKGLKGQRGYSEKYYLYDNGNEVSKSSYETSVNSIESRYRSYARNYVAPKVAIPSSFSKSTISNDPYRVVFGDPASFSGVFYGKYLNINEAHTYDGVAHYGHNNGATGTNANIFVYDLGANLGDLSKVSFVATSGCNNSDKRGVKMTRMNTSRRLGVASLTAPGARIYQYDEYCNEESKVFPTLPVNPENRNIQVGLMNASAYTNNTSNTNIYGEESAILDDYIYYNRVTGVAPMYNNNNYAASVNAISVGGVDAFVNAVDYSNISNPMFASRGANFIKPEISSFDYLFSDEAKIYNVYNGTTLQGNYAAYTGGLEVASSYVAGVVSDLVSLYPFYKWHPELVKALLLSTGYDNTPNKRYEKDCRISSSVTEVGMARPSFKDMVSNNRSRYWMGKNDSHFNSSNEITFTETGITKGSHYRVAIAWLMRGDYMISKNTIAQDIDLKVIVTDENGKEKTYSSTAGISGYEMVEFDAPSAKDIRVVIKRYSNRGGRVLLGYNMHENL